MKYELKIDKIEEIGTKLGIDPTLIYHVTRNQRFPLWSGSSKEGHHHYGQGGLQYHTWEVIELTLKNAMFLEQSSGHRLNPRILYLASLFHDFGKIEDYYPLNTSMAGAYQDWGSTNHKREIHHISRSGIEWSIIARKLNLPDSVVDDVLHCILSHHGQREWGSPVAPHSREAWLLFLCDGISARCNDCDTLDMVGKVKHV